ncbi:somatostatin receptor type 2-like protein, partial [Leptotrombidium deliense]
IIGVFGNLLVFYIIFRFSIMKNVANIYTMNLVISNLIYVTWIPFYLAEEYIGYWSFGSTFCQVHKYAGYVSYTVTNILVTIISADRYMAVCHPSRLNIFETYRFSMISSIFVWPLALLFRFPMFSYAMIKNTSCSLEWPDHIKNTWFVVNAVVGFLITSVLVLVMYLFVIIKLKKNESEGTTLGTVSMSTNRATTNLALMVALVYLLCWTPYWFISVIRRYADENESMKNRFLLKLSLAIGIGYAAISPVLYVIFDAKFKKCFNNIFGIKNTRIRRITTDALNLETRKESNDTTNTQTTQS